MGVTGLWEILKPCARPIKLETLNRKRLAVDASIWIYQFLKAVRDKEGNALRNSHIVGFFRRICKLLFFGIKPVFVFDGGAPILKRQTVSERKKRREGRREDAVRTAGRLLAVQMQRRAEEEEQKRKEANGRRDEQEEEVPDEGLVYVDEIGMTQQERKQNRKFKKKDAYHLPDLDVSMNEMGGPNDPRVMSLEDLQSYAKQFETGEDINVYDFSKIDYDSPFFVSLPASDRYNILNAARLRSRLRMGHSKEQLDSMFPDRMAFSKFQIDRVRERNELTQRLMHLNEGGDTLFGDGGRVAGEKGREYILVKNDGVEGGWALGVISDEGTKEENAIDLDKPAPVFKQDDEDWEDDDEFEDVPIEGLNRLPKRQKLDPNTLESISKQRKSFYNSRRAGGRRKPKPVADSSSLFVPEDPMDDAEEKWEEVEGADELFGDDADARENNELQRAIAMSLESGQPDDSQRVQDDEDDDDMREVFHQSAVPEARPIPKGSGKAIANLVNKRAFGTAPESREITSFGVPRQKSESDHEDEDTMDFQAALAESRRTTRKPRSPPPRQPSRPKPKDAVTEVAKQAGFSGPLPFEKLDLGSSLLGKKKMQERAAETAGGFENLELVEKESKKAEPLPPWFAGDLDEDIRNQKALETEDREQAKNFRKQFQFQSREPERLRGAEHEVIDLDVEDEALKVKSGEVVDLEDDTEESMNADLLEIGEQDERQPTLPETAKEPTAIYDPKIRMGDVADKARLEPPATAQDQHRRAPPPIKQRPAMFEDDDSDEDDVIQDPLKPSTDVKPDQIREKQSRAADEEEELLEWSESEGEEQITSKKPAVAEAATDTGMPGQSRDSRSPSVEFEDVGIPDKPSVDQPRPSENTMGTAEDLDGPIPASGLVNQDNIIPDEELETAEFDDFSDPEDEALFLQLAAETEEHARFASTLNSKTQAQNVADYETELKQLRNQQKKDRRDADEVTQVMIQECQQLLRLFGLPYVTAPMEAEAQCAELVKLGLVDGIVTDDSDCFLFGGTRVYKNMFNQAKFVECYLTSDLEKEFNLTRDKLIRVAHLLGSDYTEGLSGVGPVTAIELLGEFGTLEAFKEWWSGVQMNTIPKAEDADKPFRKKFRRNATKLFLESSFPDARVDIAYMTPEVDSDPQPFQWGVPDLDSLRSFLMMTIGWSQERTDEVLVPVIKDMNRRADEGTQSNITAFFDGGVGIGAAGATKNSASGEVFAPRRKVAEGSKRMGTALTKMAEQAEINGNGTNQPVNIIGTTRRNSNDEVDPHKAGARNTGKRASKSKPASSAGSESGSDSYYGEPEDQPRKRLKAGNVAKRQKKRAKIAA